VTTGVWINGDPQPADAAHVHARDRGLTLADGVFETMRVRGGTIFRRAQHLERLSRALHTLGIPEPASLRAWLETAASTLGHGEGSVRLTVTRGASAGGGVAPPPGLTPTVIVVAGPTPPFPATTYEQGLSAQIAAGRRNEHAMSAGLKTLAYTDAVLALLAAQRAGADEALFLDTEGHCSEATSSNLFIWTGTLLQTPPISCAALPGITRAAVLELARAHGLAVAERALLPDDLYAAEEAFLTSSLRGIAPLVRVNRRAIGTGTPGPTTRRISAAYDELVARECGG
jgi:branched-chain amino acid aminotransferase